MGAPCLLLVVACRMNSTCNAHSNCEKMKKKKKLEYIQDANGIHVQFDI